MDFNEKQKEAVKYYGGPLLILAGAGSGKTRCIVGKVIDLISKGTALNKILAFTFTNKAANELKERVQKETGKKEAPWIGTIHSICVKILKAQGLKFEICDSSDSKKIAKEAIENKNYDPKEVSAAAVCKKISLAKMSMFLPEDMIGQVRGNRYVSFKDHEISIYAEYDRITKACGLKDFDDLILDVVKMLEKNQNVLKKYRAIFDYILVDEYQDINPVQDRLIKLLAGDGKRLTVVGDDQQSIYGFRGSDPEFIIHFPQSFEGVKIVKLEQNYRSSQNILNVANHLIAQADYGLQKNLWSNEDEGEKVTYAIVKDTEKEIDFVRETIQTQVDLQGASYKDFAVLYRTNVQAIPFDIDFTKHSIPHQIINSLSFFDRVEVKDIIAYLKFIKNPSNILAFKRIISTPSRGIGLKTSEKTIVFSRENFGGNLIKGMDSANKKVEQFRNLILELVNDSKNMNAGELIKKVVEKIKYREFLENKYEKEADLRWERVEALMDMALTKKKSLGDFLDDVALAGDLDNHDPEENAVTFITIHSAKGLEFKKVFLIGFEDDLLPHAMAKESGFQISEERRLFYVAITRAEEQLYLTRRRTKISRGMEMETEESPFLKELPKDKLITQKL